jgi:hypothetical protein
VVTDRGFFMSVLKTFYPLSSFFHAISFHVIHERFFCVPLEFLFSTPRKKGEQMDFRGGGIRGIKAEAFFYYHSIIKRKQTHKTKNRHTKAIIHTQKNV